MNIIGSKAAGADLRFTNVISGIGSITTSGTGAVSLRGINIYTGNTVLAGSGAITLADNSGMKFVVGANGLNNMISGTAGQTITLDGDFTFDLSGAATSGNWTIVDVASLNETFSSTFAVNGFTESANVWTQVVGPATYSFSEATGILSASAVPEPSTGMAVFLGMGALVLFGRRRLHS